MFSALNDKGQLVNFLDNIPISQLFYCPACGAAVTLKKGRIMRPHFAHIRLQDCHYFSENESAEHLQLKAELYVSLSQTQEVGVERILPDLGQVADLLVNGKLALEVQCSRLSKERLYQRTVGYQNHDIQVLWLLGKKLWLSNRINALQKQFLYFSQNMGFHIWELDSEKRQISLHYMIYQDLEGKLHYLTKTCFFDDDVMDFFRLPYQKQKIETYMVKQHQKPQIYIQKQLIAKHSIWLKRQEEAYLKRKNLLSQQLSDFYPQVRPLDDGDGFYQIQIDLSDFYNNFYRYYQNEGNQTVQVLYPPAFYGKIVETKN